MKKHVLPLVLAVPLALTACGQAEGEPENLDDKTLVTIGEWKARMECIHAVDDANAETKNMPVIAHEPTARFMVDSEGSEGHMNWKATIYTHAGIPWEHDAECIVDLSGEDPEVIFLDVQVAR